MKPLPQPFWLPQWLKTLTTENEFGIPIRNFARVNEAIYRGALPDTDGYRTLHETLGVRRVCSLIEHQTLEDREHALRAGMTEWIHIPFSDRSTPPAERVREWLAYLRTATSAAPIYTHCRGGRHRTGTLIAVLRVTDYGWTKQQAYVEMLKHGWYGALGHEPLTDWFFTGFEPEDYR